MILVSQSYTAGSHHRNEELRECRIRNEESGLFDRVEYLDGESRVLSFSELFDHCTSRYRGKWCVIANSDITFGSTSYLLKSLRRDGRLVALTRWEGHSGPRFLGHQYGDGFFSGSQDSWAFVAGSLPRPDSDIPLAVNGCDQVIAGWACDVGCEVVNPSLSIKTTHVHAVDDRTDSRGAMAGLYGYPQITTMRTTGDVLCHDWPRSDGEWEFEWRLYRSAK